MKLKIAALNVNGTILFLLGLLDFIRGITHTFRIEHAALNLAQIDPHPDALVLMAAFGMSNFLTGSLFVLISLKARKLAPTVLLLIPAAYMLGGLGMKVSNVTLQSPFIGQHMIKVCLTVSLMTALFYYICVLFERQRSE